MVSVIIPVYKAEQYFEQSVNSVLTQDYTDIEVILIDDQSPDKCPMMCDAFAEKDSRVRVIHQENRGVSVARNVGLDIARGEYIMFVDSDDALPPGAISTFVKLAEEYNPSLVVGDYDDIDVPKNWKPGGVSVIGKEEAADFIYRNVGNSYGCSVWSKLYKRELCGRNIEEIKVSEDLVFNMDYAYRCQSIVVYKAPLYSYRRTNLHSLTHGFKRDKIKSYYAVYQAMKNMAVQNNENSKQFDILRHHFCRMAFNAMTAAYIQDCSFSKKLSDIKSICEYDFVREEFSQWQPAGFKSKLMKSLALAKNAPMLYVLCSAEMARQKAEYKH